MKIALFYYSQSGQAYKVARNIFDVIGLPESKTENENVVIYKEIIPEQDYPFPWPKYLFFDTFPETRLSLPPSGIKPIDYSDIDDADLIVIVGQSWFLSPSLPLQSFFANQQIKDYLSGRNVVFINVCRNMWLMTARWIKSYLKEVHANFVGHIVFQDKRPNLISAATIVRWLIHGKKDASLIFPSAGVSQDDIMGASIFGQVIKKAVISGNYKHLQSELLTAGAINYKPSILHIEQIGHRMFGLWARFVRRKGGFRDPHRQLRIRFFYIYLIIVLFVLSPFAQLVFYVTYPFHHISRNKMEDCSV